MLARYALRELAHHRVRTALAVAGVAVATALLLDMLMLGRGIESSFSELLSGRDYGIRVTPAGTLPFDTEATIPAFATLADTLREVDGVDGIAPVLAANLEAAPVGAGALSAPDGETGITVLVLGVDPEEQGVLTLFEGGLPGPGQAVVDERLSDELGLATGDSIRLAPRTSLGVAGTGETFEVSGVARFLYGAREDRSAAIVLPALQRLTNRPDAAAFAMIRTVAGADPDTVRAAIAAAAPRVDAVTVSGLVERAEARLSYFRQLALILGTVSVVVASLLVGTIMIVSINDRFGTIAALRAMGVSRRSILGAFTAESLALCAVAVALGLALGLATAGYLERVLSDFPGLPRAIRFFVADASALGLAAGLVLFIGAVAGLAPAWHAARLDIATTLHREEP